MGIFHFVNRCVNPKCDLGPINCAALCKPTCKPRGQAVIVGPSASLRVPDRDDHRLGFTQARRDGSGLGPPETEGGSDRPRKAGEKYCTFVQFRPWKAATIKQVGVPGPTQPCLGASFPGQVRKRFSSVFSRFCPPVGLRNRRRPRCLHGSLRTPRTPSTAPARSGRATAPGRRPRR